MVFDICITTHNSAKWVLACIHALCAVRYDLKNLNLYFIDKGSSDNTLDILLQQKKKYENQFSAFNILNAFKDDNPVLLRNVAAAVGKGDFIFFSRIETEIFPDAFGELEKMIAASTDEYGAYELRQFPHETTNYYNPVTLEMSWASDIGMVVRRSIFDTVGGYDKSFFSSCADIELSWHIRAEGYKIRYVPNACIWYDASHRCKEAQNRQRIEKAVGSLMLRYKYCAWKALGEWKQEKISLEATLYSDRDAWLYYRQLLSYAKRKKRKNRVFYKRRRAELKRLGAFFDCEFLFSRSVQAQQICVKDRGIHFTVIIRTFQRPEVLARTLESLRWQTYPYFTVLVVEDGCTPVSRATAENAAKWLDIAYIAIGEHKGRCNAGNVGVLNAQTDYICFLDDDDCFFADHFETMAGLIQENPKHSMYCAGAVEGHCSDAAAAFGQARFISLRNTVKSPLGAIDFFVDNPVPIQAVVFRKTVYQQCGGLDVNLDALEDWDLWMRMICQAPMVSIAKATSVFCVPSVLEQRAARYKKMDEYRAVVFRKMEAYQLPFTAQQVYKKAVEVQSKNGVALDIEAWRKKAVALSTSSSWCATERLRSVAHAFIHKIEKCVGPAKTTLFDKTAQELFAYCTALETSLCWRVVRRVTHRLKNRNKKQ